MSTTNPTRSPTELPRYPLRAGPLHALCHRTLSDAADADPGSLMIPVNQPFLRRPRPDSPSPPLATLVSVGRGAGDVRLRLWLWVLALGTQRLDDAVASPGQRGWAELCGLIGPDATSSERRSGALRVNRAIDALSEIGLIERSGRNELRLLADDASGRPYRPITAAAVKARLRTRAKKAEKKLYERMWRETKWWPGPPLDLPGALWANGWVSTLRASELAVLLVLWTEWRDAVFYDRADAPAGTYKRHATTAPWPPPDTTRRDFRMPRTRDSQYGLSKQLWSAGRHGLESLGLIETKDTAIGGAAPTVIYRIRRRNLDRLAPTIRLRV